MEDFFLNPRLWGIFVLFYFAIAGEHGLRVDKLVPALLMMLIMWGYVAVFGVPLVGTDMEHAIEHYLSETAAIIFFLMGAMSIVNTIEHFDGFETINDLVTTTNKRTLLWIFGSLAFVLSAIIDNLTATIVLITILQKMIPGSSNRETRLWFAGMTVLCANAGGAWSPIGDVTTTMLWMAGKVTAPKLAAYALIPSLLCMIVPTSAAMLLPAFRGHINPEMQESRANAQGRKMLVFGLLAIVCVPIMKIFLHLPPWLGMLGSFVATVLYAEKITGRKFSLAEVFDSSGHATPLHRVLSRTEMNSLLFFIGILMSVAVLQATGDISQLGNAVRAFISNEWFALALGFGSAIVDNVPLVAASLGMFDLPPDHHVWHLIAYTAGTGGSMLVIGSAAGVVAMGMEKIQFGWYAFRIGPLAALGFLTGYAYFIVMI